ncbi:hypothetical protein ABZS86_26070 [Streptomyces sp. NPDC005355]|uniref:hypothetical protein n=1 Tax=Streptomyces sp. NPDC005355 TaxID=3157038 RepID=UPI0033BA96D2
MTDTSPATPRANTPAHGDCDVCAALLRQQADARRAGDHSRATDCVVRLQRHHQGPLHREVAS